MQVVALTRDDAPGCLVELVRCGGCGQNLWRLDGVEVEKGRALAALSAAFAPSAPAPRPVRVRPRPHASSPPAADANVAQELTGLLAGWRVLGG